MSNKPAEQTEFARLVVFEFLAQPALPSKRSRWVHRWGRVLALKAGHKRWHTKTAHSSWQSIIRERERECKRERERDIYGYWDRRRRGKVGLSVGHVEAKLVPSWGQLRRFGGRVQGYLGSFWTMLLRHSLKQPKDTLPNVLPPGPEGKTEANQRSSQNKETAPKR